MFETAIPHRFGGQSLPAGSSAAERTMVRRHSLLKEERRKKSDPKKRGAGPGWSCSFLSALGLLRCCFAL